MRLGFVTLCGRAKYLCCPQTMKNILKHRLVIQSPCHISFNRIGVCNKKREREKKKATTSYTSFLKLDFPR